MAYTRAREGHEWRLGRAAEQAVRRWYQTAGWYVVPLYAIEDGGAPRLAGAIKSHVLPDLQVARAGALRWVEVKGKNIAPYYQKTRRYRHGVNLRNWRAYLEVEAASGVPGYLAIVQLRPGPDVAIAPQLLVASFATLRADVQIRSADGDGFEMAFFDVDAFERFALPRDAAAPFPDLAPRRVHPWERGQTLPPRQLPLWTPGE